MICLVFSTKDLFSRNIREIIRENGEIKKELKLLQCEMFTSEKDTVEIYELPEGFIDYIFISRHESKSNIKTVSFHFTGDYKKFSIANACLLKSVVRSFTKEFSGNKWKKFYIGIEATHHGPVIDNKRILFVEVGSTKDEWTNKEICNKFLNALILAIKNYNFMKSCKSLLAVGFKHYSRKLTRIIKETSFSIGHIIPIYALESMKKEDIIEAFYQTFPIPEGIIISGNISKDNREKILKAAKELKVNVIQID